MRTLLSEDEKVILTPNDKNEGCWDISVKNIDIELLLRQKRLLATATSLLTERYGDAYYKLEGIVNLLDSICDPYLDELEKDRDDFVY